MFSLNRNAKLSQVINSLKAQISISFKLQHRVALLWGFLHATFIYWLCCLCIISEATLVFNAIENILYTWMNNYDVSWNTVISVPHQHSHLLKNRKMPHIAVLYGSSAVQGSHFSKDPSLQTHSMNSMALTLLNSHILSVISSLPFHMSSLGGKAMELDR